MQPTRDLRELNAWLFGFGVPPMAQPKKPPRDWQLFPAKKRKRPRDYPEDESNTTRGEE